MRSSVSTTDEHLWDLRRYRYRAKLLKKKSTRPGGVEPPASSSAGKRSIHLSYGRSTTLAERLGFEPRVDLSAYTRLAGARLRPLGHLS
jgi:hypothetical protein